MQIEQVTIFLTNITNIARQHGASMTKSSTYANTLVGMFPIIQPKLLRDNLYIAR